MSGDGDSVGNLADDVKLLDADLVNLVEDVDAGNVGSVTLHHINKFIRCSITPVVRTINKIQTKLITQATYLSVMSALEILYSAKIVFTRSRSSSDCGTIVWRLIPPFSFFLKIIFGGVLFSL